MTNCCSHGTLLHFGLQSSHFNICYYHQDLHYTLFHPDSRLWLLHSAHALLLIGTSLLQRWLSIGLPLQRHQFSGLVHSEGELLHSLADSDFQGHRPAVYMNQHLSWYLMSVDLGALAQR